jgi:hypothetical protein
LALGPSGDLSKGSFLACSTAVVGQEAPQGFLVHICPKPQRLEKQVWAMLWRAQQGLCTRGCLRGEGGPELDSTAESVQRAGVAASSSRQQGSAWPGTQLRSGKRQHRAPPGSRARPRPTAGTAAAVAGLGTGIGRRGGWGEPQGVRAASMLCAVGRGLSCPAANCSNPPSIWPPISWCPLP